MANSAGGNVVALGEHARARGRPPRAEFADALSACRALALDRMADALSRMLDRIEDELFQLAESAQDREQQNTYLDARTQARAKRGAIESTFRAHFVDLFDRKVQGRSVEAAPAALSELALVEPEALEETLAVREMARKLGAACEGELFALSQRMGFMLERPELADEANPVAPATICAALKDACDQIESGFKVRMALLHQLERHAVGALNGIYHEINAQLIERRILPEVRLGVRRVPNAATRMPQSAAPQSAAPQSGAPREGVTQQDVFATLSQWLSQATAVSRGPGGDGTGAAPNAAASGATDGVAAAGGAPGAPDAQLVAQLTRMHREAGGQAVESAQALVNTVKAIRSSPLAASLGSVDAMTIDVVGMLFDYIFEDRHIAASVKAQLARLQLPTLKVALLDKGFFSSASHPARRLLDVLAECAIGIDEFHAQDSDVLALVESVVGKVLAEFETDLELFAAQAKRVEDFMHGKREAESALVERSARLLEERERREGAIVAARTEVERRIDERAWLPAPVRTMLAGPWVAAMAEAFLDQGPRGPAWHELVLAMDELAWSVEPKVAPEDRRRLVTTLPAMLARLAAGLERGGVSKEGRDEFFGSLVDCHAGAVKAGLRGIAVLPQAPAIEEDKGGLERELVPAGDLQLEEIRLRPPRGAKATRNVFTRTGIWTNLQRGTWVEFAPADGPRMRARLTWISPNKGVYLFTSPLSQAAALSISPEALAEQMRMGEARMLDDGPLVERAVGSMIASLRPAA
ncbi:MAG TPA: DUF1631 family protein [Usitatibacter sp.]|jgi:hypothetical protein|nr:DUF1631 family protein [Usitatibacter sp.]